MLFNDPVEFEEFLAPVAGDVLIRPAIGAVFSAEVCMTKLEHVGIFTVSANTFEAVKDPQQDLYGLTIPLRSSFAISESGRRQEYEPSSAHLLSPGHTFNLTAKRKCSFLVANFFVNSVSDYSRKLMQSNSRVLQLLSPDISFLSQHGSTLLRSVAKTWSVLNSSRPASEIILKELEDDLLSSLVFYSSEDMHYRRSYEYDASYHLNRAEEYICSNLKKPITRDQLAEVSSRSIRTLSRAFERRYGVGPMSFIKQRRLDAAYLDLLNAEADATTVTQVAFNYGFMHVGKFAIEYKKVFGESPSTSLLK